MITISRSAKFVVSPGQRVFVEEKDNLPHFTIMPCFNPEGEGPPPMLVVPSLAGAREVFSAWSAQCFIATSDGGWVGAATWLEWAHGFCDLLEGHRHRKGADVQTAILFVDSASARGNLAALEVFRAHNVLIVTLPPHLTQVLQPVDATWARCFKSGGIQRLRYWGRNCRRSCRSICQSRGES
jgi:hypothetical protein